MDKETFDNIVHTSFLIWIIDQVNAHKEFEAETGFDITVLKGRSVLDVMIDKSTGYEQDIMHSFIVWATETYWSTSEDAEHIEAYRNAKEYLENRNNINGEEGFIYE